MFQLRMAIFTQCQENFSVSTNDEETAPCESIFMRCIANSFSYTVRNFECEGVCGRKKPARSPKRIVMTPSMKNMNGLDGVLRTIDLI